MRALVIVVRGLHLGYVGCYGNDWIDTPALDGLAAEGVVFDQHFADRPDPGGAAQAWRTGRYAFPPAEGEDSQPPDPDADRIGLLRGAGVGMTCVKGIPLERALDEALGAVERLASGDRGLVWVELAALLPPWDVPPDYLAPYFQEETGDEEEDDHEDDKEPLDPLPDPAPGPVLPPTDTTFLRLQRTYAGAVSFVDAGLGRLFEQLREGRLLDDLLVVITTDHGLPLGEHGVVGLYRPWLHDELIHLPLLVRLPGGAEAGRRVAALTQPVDLFPTLLDAFGLPAAPAHGQSLLPLLRGEREQVRPYACAGLRVGPAAEWALRTPDWSFLLPVPPAPDGPPRLPQLYVKPDDRWEVNDVRQHHLDLAEHLEQTLRGFVEATRRPGPLHVPELRDVEAELAQATADASPNHPPGEETPP
jgi:arylsulfatase A-like enzyme